MRHLHARRWFRLDAHDEGEGSGSGEGGGEGGGQGGGNAGAGDGGGGEGGGAGDGKSFTQADLDRIVQERLARERQKYSDYDDVKAKAEKFDELEAEQQTELERAQAERDREKQAREASDARARRVATRVAVLEQAGGKDITDPKLAARLLDGDQVEFDDDGEPTNIGELLDALVEEHPILTTTAGSGGGGEGGDGPGNADGGTGSGGDDGGGGGGGKDFTKASDSEFAGELARYGLRPR